SDDERPGLRNDGGRDEDEAEIRTWGEVVLLLLGCLQGSVRLRPAQVRAPEVGSETLIDAPLAGPEPRRRDRPPVFFRLLWASARVASSRGLVTGLWRAS